MSVAGDRVLLHNTRGLCHIDVRFLSTPETLIMKLYHILFTMLVLIATKSAFAQNIQTATIEWTCNSTFVATPGTLTDEPTKVVSSQETITWYDNNGTVRQTLTIVDAIGSWSNVSNNGSIMLNVTAGDDRGLVQFVKNGSSTTIRIQIIATSEIQLYELTVNSLTTL
jgi:hypothetical protein